ncbi:MAG: radical SAM protein, partial [Planctomycetota bacterium]
TTPAQLADIALRLTAEGCENVNFVTPTHFSHAVAEAVRIARQRGLSAPIVYNCGGYESVETLRLLDGLVDIYMPDFKYADPAAGQRYSAAEDYPTVAGAALAEMHRRLGPPEIDPRGVMTRGVLVRHLVMPDDVAESKAVLDLVADTAPGCAVNVMGQYRPCYRAREFPELDEMPSGDEVRSLREYAQAKGLRRVD